MHNASTPRNPLTVVFSTAMAAPSGSFSPSSDKPAKVVADWAAAGLPLDLVAPTPATPDDLALAHDRRYVDDVLALRRPNGFGDRSPAVAAALPYTSGAMLTGARLALQRGGAVCAPCSGFHHAHWGSGGGFCTFNGLMVAALGVLGDGLARRVAIVDCDMHYGDGTDEILERLGNPASIRHFTAGSEFHHSRQVAAFFARLDEELAALAGFDLVLYQAGADPHLADPLGGWLTTEQLRERDARVFEALARHRVPVVWNLAGGYQRDADGGIAPVLAIHRNTAREHARVFGERLGARDAGQVQARRAQITR